tara:strand:+ start:450 stop:977 length:528 start_codon:yes stop_codon:yes gene_type:complete
MSTSYVEAKGKLYKIIKDGMKRGDSFKVIESAVKSQLTTETKSRKWKDQTIKGNPATLEHLKQHMNSALGLRKEKINEAAEEAAKTKAPLAKKSSADKKAHQDALMKKYGTKQPRTRPKTQKIKFSDLNKKEEKKKKDKAARRAFYSARAYAPAFDAFPKESQEKDHPLYGNLRY